LNRFVQDLPIDTLSDEEILALCDSQMEEDEQILLNELLSAQREGELTQTQRETLDELMSRYRHGLVRKAEALKIAVARGLRQPLGS
jgi:hypothetical protein